MTQEHDNPQLRLTQDVEAVLQDATRRILILLDRHERSLLAQVEKRAVAAAPSRAAAREIRHRVHTAIASSLEAMGAAPTPGRVSTDTVAARLRSIIGANGEGLLASALRRESGYSAMQIHRALAQLQEAGEVERVGPARRTRYRPTRRLRRRLARRAREQARPPRTPSTRGNGIEADLLRLLGRRKRGLARRELTERSGYTAAQVKRALRVLRTGGQVETVGAGPHTRYRRC